MVKDTLLFFGGGDQEVKTSLSVQPILSFFFFFFYQTGPGTRRGPETGLPYCISLALQITPNKPLITQEITQLLLLPLFPDPPLAHFISHGLASWPLPL